MLMLVLVLALITPGKQTTADAPGQGQDMTVQASRPLASLAGAQGQKGRVGIVDSLQVPASASPRTPWTPWTPWTLCFLSRAGSGSARQARSAPTASQGRNITGGGKARKVRARDRETDEENGLTGKWVRWVLLRPAVAPTRGATGAGPCKLAQVFCRCLAQNPVAVAAAAGEI